MKSKDLNKLYRLYQTSPKAFSSAVLALSDEDFKYIQQLQKGGPLSVGPSISQFTVTDSKPKPTTFRSEAQKAFYENFLNTEIGSDYQYYQAPLGIMREVVPDIVSGKMRRDRKGQIEATDEAQKALKEGRIPDPDKVVEAHDMAAIDDLFSLYLERPQRYNTIQKSEHPAPGAKGETYKLPPELEDALKQDVAHAYSYLSNDADLMKDLKRRNKDGFLPIHAIGETVGMAALGEYTAWYNPETGEIRYYDEYDLDRLPLVDKLVGKPFHIYNRIQGTPAKDIKVDKKQQGGMPGNSNEIFDYIDGPTKFKSDLTEADWNSIDEVINLTKAAQSGDHKALNTVLRRMDILKSGENPSVERSLGLYAKNRVMDIETLSQEEVLEAIARDYYGGAVASNPKYTELDRSQLPTIPQTGPVREYKKGGKRWKRKLYQEGGPVGPKAVQLEVDEMIMTPQLDIIDTAAKEKHKNMKNDEVTDILRPEDYVFSADPKMKMTRKRAEKMSFGYTAVKYKEGDKPKPPVEITAADLFEDGEDEIPIAEYVRRIRKKYPTVDKEDVLARQTNQYNKESRLPYLAAAVYENERQRTKGTGEEMAPFAPAFINEFAEQKIPGNTMKYGGKVLQKKRTSNYQLGGVIAQGVQGLIQIGDAVFGAPRRRKLGEKALTEDNAAINTLAGTQQGFNSIATGAQLAGTILQDPTVNAPQYDTTQLDASIRRTPRSMFDYAAGRLAAGNKNYLDTLVANTGSLSEAVNLYTPAAAATSSATANLGFQEAQSNIQLENAYRNAKQRISEAQVAADTGAENATRFNSNEMIANAASTTAAGVGRSGDIESNRQNARRTNRMNYWQNRINSNQQTWQGLASGVGSIAGAFYNASALGVGQPQGVNTGANTGYNGIGLSLNSPGVPGVVTQPYQGLLPPNGFTLGRDAAGNLIVIPAGDRYGGILPVN